LNIKLSHYCKYTFDELLIFKKHGVRLAAYLKKKITNEKKDELVIEINKWEKIAFSESEFNDIKIEWLKNVES